MSSIAMFGLVFALVWIRTGACCGALANCTGTVATVAGAGALLLIATNSGVPRGVLR